MEINSGETSGGVGRGEEKKCRGNVEGDECGQEEMRRRGGGR